MGKIRKAKIKSKTNLTNLIENDNTTVPDIHSFSSSFDFSMKSFNKEKPDDIKSVLSYKSVKSHKSSNKIIKKKDKLSLKRKLLLKKIDLIDEMNKQKKMKDKRKNTLLIGDITALHDALPSLESLLKCRSDVDYKVPKKPKKKKAIEKVHQRKKKLISDMDFFKRAMSDKTFKSDPFDIISSHIQAIVQRERSKVS